MTVEKQLKARSGWPFLPIALLLLAAAVAGMVWSVISIVDHPDDAGAPVVGIVGIIASVVLLVCFFIFISGFFTLQPGQAKVCILFGTYKGTVRESGFFWANPFYANTLNDPDAEAAVAAAVMGNDDEDEEGAARVKGLSTKMSLRARTLNGKRLKVNDKMGNPIEIATVVVWHVSDTARAMFDVDHYPSYVAMQTETALRHVASVYAYDHMEDDDTTNTSITLRSNIEEVSESLREELDRRLEAAGVNVIDARLTHLAYAPEIAPAMLRRQQAEAVIAARKKIVEGAVGMVDMAVRELAAGSAIELDEERRATMATNLMVVLCGETEAQPVVNAGSLY
ncbi:MAG: SPFH domain-containing protein [Coriobacteriaceae bacterium]|nr:SPFH domain-containing protein [Coriobacteriaceae bacterium]